MSLLCVETRTDIVFGQLIRAIVHQEKEIVTAISAEVIRRIPLDDRLMVPLASSLDGYNFYEATSKRNFNGSYTMSDFESGQFLFSITRETAERCLPVYAKMAEKW